MSRVLVTDGDQRAALAVVRSLGARGDEVYVCSPSGRSLAGASRFCRGESPLTATTDDPHRYASAVRAILERRAADVLIPITDASLEVLLSAAELGRVKIPFPSAQAFELVSDKRRLLEVARLAGVRVPRQRVLETRAEVDDLLDDVDAFPFPAVVKPSRAPPPCAPPGGSPGVTYACDAAGLGRVLAGYAGYAFPLLVQERVRGPGIGVFVLIWDGKVRAHFAHRRIREKPPSGGVSVCRETGTADHGLLEASRTILGQVGWRGVAMVEFKIDALTGTPVLMEVNGRFWGSLQLAIDAGVDFPALLLDAMEGKPAPVSLPTWRYVRSRWLWGEADHLLARIRRAKPGQPPRERPLLDRLAAVAEVLSWKRGDRTEVLRMGDPRPFLLESMRRIGWRGAGGP
jgi:predicted ATP-grasp superfamily ATP-dependent carboligase